MSRATKQTPLTLIRSSLKVTMHRIRIVIAPVSDIYPQTFFFLVVDHWLSYVKMGARLQLSPTSSLVVSCVANRSHLAVSCVPKSCSVSPSWVLVWKNVLGLLLTFFSSFLVLLLSKRSSSGSSWKFPRQAFSYASTRHPYSPIPPPVRNSCLFLLKLCPRHCSLIFCRCATFIVVV